MNIIIDANNDTLTIEDDTPCKYDLKKLRVSPYQLKNILEEILNRIDPYHTSLQYIDEDTRRTIGEW